MRSTVLAAAGLIVAVTGPLAVSATASPVEPEHEQTITRHVHARVDTVQVRGDLSRIRVVTGSATTVVAHEKWSDRQPTFTVEVSHHHLDVRIHCSDGQQVGPVSAGLVSVGCTDDLDLTIPATAPLSATSWDGNVTSTGMRAAQKLHSDTGDVNVRDARGRLTASSTDGALTVSNLRASAVHLRSDTAAIDATRVVTKSLDVRTHDGDVSANGVAANRVTMRADTGALSLATVTPPHSVTTRTNDGDIDIAVPADAYAVTVHSVDGTEHVRGLGQNPDSAWTIEARSDTGDVLVHAAD